MKTILGRMKTLAALAAMLAVVPVLAVAQGPTVSGMIRQHDGNRIVLQTSAGEKTVMLQETTKVRSIAGLFQGRREDRSQSDLIRGLAVDVTYVQVGDDLIATEVTFKPADLKTADQINAGLHATDQNVADNKRRIAEAEERLSNVGQLVSAGRTKVFFKVGRSELSDEGKRELEKLAIHAKGIKGGYRMAVVGRADPTGSVVANQKLSEARAAAVSSYLLLNCGVLPGSILPATAVGESPVASDPDQPRNPTEARRVTVTILVSKANEQS